ncbi:MAG: hypothetical protein EAZ43_16935 [Betaproteobacteria bacterium]|nr:MAG: hypothetical protein EAZ43_16935 [Betaproteobacteria bacterium]
MNPHHIAFQTAFRNATESAGWQPSKSFCRDLHFSCTKSADSRGSCGASIWATGDLDAKKPAPIMTLQANLWVRNEGLESQMSTLFGDRFLNPHGASTEQWLRHFAPPLALNDFSLFALVCDGDVSLRVESFCVSLLGAARQFVEETLSGASFARDDIVVAGNPFHDEARKVVWRVRLAPTQNKTACAITEAELRLLARVDRDISLRRALVPRQVLMSEKAEFLRSLSDWKGELVTKLGATPCD